MRRFLLVLLIAVLPVAPAALAQSEVVPGIRLLRGTFTPGTQPDGNTIMIDAPEGLVVVDTGRHAAHTQKILEYAKSSGRPIVAVINTHWHLDHIGGNAAIRAAYPGARIYASNALEGALKGFLANYRQQLQEMLQSPQSPAQKEAFEAEVRLIDSGPKLAPDVVIRGSESKSIGGRTLFVGLETYAATAGDVWLLDEASGVLIIGDLLTLPAPFLDTACPAKWNTALDKLSSRKFDLVIPGHGAPLTRHQFETYRHAFGALITCAKDAESKEPCIDRWMTAIKPLTSDDETFTRTLMNYYVDVLRKAGETSPQCGEPADPHP